MINAFEMELLDIGKVAKISTCLILEVLGNGR
jgi:hypothetical protein